MIFSKNPIQKDVASSEGLFLVMNKRFLFCLICLAIWLPSSLLLADIPHTEVDITFHRDLPGDPVWTFPNYGSEVNHPAYPDRMLNQNTTLRFSFTTTSTNGNLIVLIKNKKAAEWRDGVPPNTLPPAPPNTYDEYMRVSIPLSQAGTIQQIQIGDLSSTGIEWGETVYLGFFTESGHVSTTRAYCNGVEAGSVWNYLYMVSPEFNLEILYDVGVHPNTPSATISEQSASPFKFTDLQTLSTGDTLHGAISRNSYRLEDSQTGSPEAIYLRTWELYELDANNQLTFLDTLEGYGARAFKGNLRAPENTTDIGKRYLVLCRIIDALGKPNMAQPASLTDPDLINNFFAIEVGKDVTQNSENCIAVSYTTIIADPDPGFPSCGVDLGLGGYYRFMPIGPDIDASSNTPDGYYLEVAQDQAAPSVITDDPPLPVSAVASWEAHYVDDEDNFPVEIKWRYRNKYGLTAEKHAPTIEFHALAGGGFQGVIEHFELDSQPNPTIAGASLDLSYQINTNASLPYMVGRCWLYNPDNESQNVPLSPSIIGLSGSLQQLDDFVIPAAAMAWGSTRLAIRMKAGWGNTNAIASDDFFNSMAATIPVGYKRLAQKDSEPWLVIDNNRFLTLETEGNGQVVSSSGELDLLFRETHDGNPDQLAWRWETTVGNDHYYWVDDSWQAVTGEDPWIEIGSGLYGNGLTDPFSSRWLWDETTGTVQANPNGEPPLANVSQTFFAPPNAISSQQINVQVKMRMRFGQSFKYRQTEANLELESTDQSFTSLFPSGTGNVNPITGDMAIAFEENHSGSPNPEIAWRWQTNVGGTEYLWVGNSWQLAENMDDWIEVDSGSYGTNLTDTFSSRWQWDADMGRIFPKGDVSGSALPPLAAAGATNLLDAFFTLPGATSPSEAVNVRVRVRMGFGVNNFQVQEINDLTLTLVDPDPAIVGLNLQIARSGQTPACGESAQGDWLDTENEWIGRLGSLPLMQFRLETVGSTAAPITVQLEKVSTGVVSCVLASSNIFSTSCDNSPGVGENLVRWWTADATSGLFQTLATHGSGNYRLKFTTGDCTSDNGVAVQFTLNPAASFALRVHYRDHIGSSAISRAYTPNVADAANNTSSLQFSSGGDNVVLYASAPEWTYYEPFGKTLGNVDSETDARYTDHEYDMETGFNYMKGRYQLPEYGRFNRPDPARDWDWEKPHSINLYQYVRNNPIDSWDPFGLQVTVTGVRNEDGQVIITITYQAVLINNSEEELSEEQLEEIANRIEESFSEVYQGTEGNVTINGVAEISVVGSESDIGDSDHVIRIVDEIFVKGATGERAGLAGTNERWALIDSDILNNVPATEGRFAGTGKTETGAATLERTSAHEVGHNLSLFHPEDQGINQPNNLMQESFRDDAGLDLVYAQLRRIVDNKDNFNSGKQDQKGRKKRDAKRRKKREKQRKKAERRNGGN